MPKIDIRQKVQNLRAAAAEQENTTWEYKIAEYQRHLCPAQSRDYSLWLKGFMEAGGIPTHCYNYNMPEYFCVATGDFVLQPLYGSDAIKVIIPVGVEVRGEDIGHCNLFFMDGYKHKGRWVPLYNDFEF